MRKGGRGRVALGTGCLFGGRCPMAAPKSGSARAYGSHAPNYHPRACNAATIWGARRSVSSIRSQADSDSRPLSQTHSKSPSPVLQQPICLSKNNYHREITPIDVCILEPGIGRGVVSCFPMMQFFSPGARQLGHGHQKPTRGPLWDSDRWTQILDRNFLRGVSPPMFNGRAALWCFRRACVRNHRRRSQQAIYPFARPSPAPSGARNPWPMCIGMVTGGVQAPRALCEHDVVQFSAVWLSLGQTPDPVRAKEKKTEQAGGRVEGMGIDVWREGFEGRGSTFGRGKFKKHQHMA